MHKKYQYFIHLVTLEIFPQTNFFLIYFTFSSIVSTTVDEYDWERSGLCVSLHERKEAWAGKGGPQVSPGQVMAGRAGLRAGITFPSTSYERLVRGNELIFVEIFQ